MSAEKTSPLLPAVDPETVEHPLDGVTLDALAAEKRLPAELLASLGCVDRKRGKRPAVAIPYRDASGGTLAVRYRNALRKEPDGSDKRFSWRSGDKAVHLYGLDRLDPARAAGWVLVVEGESDCWTAWHHGIPAVGVPGKGNWKTTMAEHLAGLAVVVWQEPDAEDFPERIGRDLPDLSVIVAPDDAKDISEAHVNGVDIAAFVAELRAGARPLRDILDARRMAALPELRAACASVLEHPDPITLYRTAFAAQGYGGDLGVPEVVLLAAVSRVLAMRPGSMPVHLLILGPASAGKSYVLHIVLLFLPDEAYHVIDAGSPRTLIYDDADLRHRVAVFGESDSLPAGEDNPAASAIRNMLQDHHLHYAVTVRDPETGDFTVRDVSKPGPTTLITTSTRRLGTQLDTRVFILEVPDDHGQLAHALRAQALLELAGGTPAPEASLVAYQTYLQALAPWEVVVPFADRIAEHLAAQPVETRVVRDYARLLSLVKAVAVLRHRRRERDERGRLVAQPEDYAEVFRLVSEVYKSSNSGAGEKVREVVKAVAAHLEEGHKHATHSDIMAVLDLSKAAVSRRVGAAKRGGWLVDDEAVKGHPAKLRVGDPLPVEHGLPDPEQVGCSTVPPLTAGRSAGVFREPDNEQEHNPVTGDLLADARQLGEEIGAVSVALFTKRLGVDTTTATAVLAEMDALGWLEPGNGKVARSMAAS